MRAIFVQTLSNTILKTFHNFSRQNADTSFSALGPETEEQIKLAKDKIRFACSFEKMISDARI